MNIKIVKGPAPKQDRNRHKSKYPWASLKVGHHFVVRNVDANVDSIRACATHAQKVLDIKLSVSEQENGDVTVERTK